jgi:Holliday junction resolvase-like predicted endonuclease
VFAGHLFAGHLTQATLRALDWLARTTLTPEDIPAHQRTARRARLFLSSPARLHHHRPQFSLTPSSRRTCREGDVLCFIGVKTRTTRDVKPAEAAVDRDKQRELSMVTRDFLGQMPRSSPQGDAVESRSDVIAVYYERGHSQPSFELLQNVFSVPYHHRFARS